MRACGLTHTGKIRENNEDSYLIDINNNLLIVADGMGGHKAGEVASSEAISLFLEEYSKNKNIVNAIELSNKRLYQKSLTDDELSGMGTTFTMANIKDGILHIIHIGDSRLYLIRNSKLTLLTTDHVYEKHVITKALGTEDSIDPDYTQIELLTGDRILICSDGLTDMVKDDIILDTVINNSIEDTVVKLIDTANLNGGRDNITIILGEYYEA